MDLAAVAEGNLDAVADTLIDDRRDADAAGFGERLKARRYIDPVAINIVAFEDHVAEIDADAEDDRRAGRGPTLARASRLDRKRAFDRIDDTGELDQRAVADQLEDPPVMGGDRRVEQGLAMALEGKQRAGFVRRHHPRIADDIRGKDRREPPVGTRFSHGRTSTACRLNAPAAVRVQHI